MSNKIDAHLLFGHELLLLWREAFIASMKQGSSTEVAIAIADEAIDAARERFA